MKSQDMKSHYCLRCSQPSRPTDPRAIKLGICDPCWIGFCIGKWSIPKVCSQQREDPEKLKLKAQKLKSATKGWSDHRAT